MSFKLRSSNPVSTPLTWTEMDNNLNHLLTNMSGSNVNITGSTGIKGNTSVSGTLVVNNTLSVSNTSSVNHIHPTLDIAYDLGKSNARWNNAYIKNAVLTTITASNISGSITNSVSSSYATTSSYIITAQTASYALSASSILGGAAGYIPFWSSSTQLSSSAIRYINVGVADEILIDSVIVNMNGCELKNGASNSTGTDSYAHAEGVSTTALGTGSHSEGFLTKAYGDYSHAQGWGTVASASYQHASGKFNIVDTSNQTLFLIGNGTGLGNESTAFKVRQSGSIVIQTGSAAPTWAGVEGELKPYKSGANYFIACYIGGTWRSSSLS